MRTILAAVAGILARVRSNITRWMRIAGRWVLQTIDIAGTPAPTPAAPVETMSPADEAEPIKRVAKILAAGHRPQASDLVGLQPRQLDWLRECTRRQLCRVITAEPGAIRAHLLGRVAIKDVPRADPETVATLRRAREARGMRGIDAASNRPRRERVEELLKELDGSDPDAAWATTM